MQKINELGLKNPTDSLRLALFLKLTKAIVFGKKEIEALQVALYIT